MRFLSAACAALLATAPALADEARDAAIRWLEEDALAPQVAPAGYDISIVFYSDYQCPYCRRQNTALSELMARDPRVRIVYRDLPLFGEASDAAARAAIAASWQGRHAAFHAALMAMQGRLGTASIRKAADIAGIDWNRLQADMRTRSADIDRLLETNARQAAALGLKGTPALLVGGALIPGAVDSATLGEAVAEMRGRRVSQR